MSSFLAHKIGDRALVIFCGVLGAAGFVAGSFSTELWHMVFTMSLVGTAGHFYIVLKVSCEIISSGTSFGLASVPSITAVSFHFTKHRHLFTTLATTGGAAGGVILPFVFESVLSTSPWQYGFVVAAGIVLHLAVCGALFFEPQINDGVELSVKNVTELEETNHVAIGDKPSALLNGGAILVEEKYSRYSLWCFLLHSIIWNFGAFMYYTIIPLRLDKEGYSGYEIALVFSVISFLVIAGRLAACCFVFWKKCDVVLVFNFSMLVMGISLLWVSWKQSLLIYLIGFSIYGFFFGLATAVIPSVIITIVGIDRVKKVVGLEFFTAGISGLIGPFLAGWLADWFNNDFFVVCIISSILFVAAVPILLPFHWPIRKLS